MKIVRDMSIKWKVVLPIIILAFLLVIACVQSNIATARMMEYSAQIAAGMGETTADMQEVLQKQEALYEGMRSSNAAKLVIAVLATILLLLVAAEGVLKPLLAMNNKLNSIMENIDSGNGDLSERVSVRGKDEIGQLAQGINAFIESLESVMHEVSSNSDRLHQVTNTLY